MTTNAMKTPPVVTPQEWETARQQLLVKEKALTRARDALAAERRRMPWMAVAKDYHFEGPQGRVGLLDLFEGRRQLIIYRAFFEPGVFGWPDHACRGCSLGADQVAHLSHLNARDTTLVYASRAPQKDIERLKARMGWKMPWYTITDSFDGDFGVNEWHGHNVFIRDGEKIFRTYFINNRGDEAMGSTWSYLDLTPLGRQETWEDSPEGYPQTPPYKWWNWHDSYGAEATPNPKWIDIIANPQEAARKRAAEEKICCEKRRGHERKLLLRPNQPLVESCRQRGFGCGRDPAPEVSVVHRSVDCGGHRDHGPRDAGRHCAAAVRDGLRGVSVSADSAMPCYIVVGRRRGTQPHPA